MPHITPTGTECPREFAIVVADDSAAIVTTERAVIFANDSAAMFAIKCTVIFANELVSY